MAVTKTETIYCQRCLSPNTLEQENCVRCGTRLMLIVEPSNLRYEDEVSVRAEYDEHLLERVSALENKIQRITNRLEKMLDALLRQSRTTAQGDHLLLETLISVLSEAKMINKPKLDSLWRKRCEQNKKVMTEADAYDAVRKRIASSYHGKERSLFARLIDEGFSLIEKGAKERGIRTLERASALAPHNALLAHLIGDYFFQAGKTTLAQDYLERAYELETTDARVCLLLGLTYGDEGELERAKELLREAVRLGDDSFAAHFALGRIYAAEENWQEALKEFKRALAARSFAETHYVVALVYYQLARYRLALRHLNKAVNIDPNYAEAHYLLGLVHLNLGEEKGAREAFSEAYAIDREETRYRAVVAARRRRRLPKSDELQPASLGPKGHGRKRFLTGGDKRLAAALIEDVRESAIVR